MCGGGGEGGDEGGGDSVDGGVGDGAGGGGCQRPAGRAVRSERQVATLLKSVISPHLIKFS